MQVYCGRSRPAAGEIAPSDRVVLNLPDWVSTHIDQHVQAANAKILGRGGGDSKPLKVMTQYILGVDIGTTSTKAVLFSTDGEMVDQHSMGYPLLSPQPEIQEQDPEEIYRAVVGSVQGLIDRYPQQAKSLVGMSFSSAMHSLIAVDSKGKALTHSITWADRRSAAWVDNIRQQCDGHALYVRTGTPIHSMSPLVKLMWLRNEHAALFKKAAKFISIKEFVLYRWFEQYVVDYSIANATGLFNMETLDWDREAIALVGITPQQLPEIVPTTHILSGMSQDVANQMGLAHNLPVVVGASDGVLANLGVGAITPETIAITVGTSGAVRTMLNHPQTDKKERLFCYALTPDRWVTGGAINNGGIILRWVRDHLADSEVATARLLRTDAYDLLTEIAATVPAGSAGLIFHPFLAGERAPIWNANARGSFFGLGLNHTKPHLIRAVLEGIVYNLHSVAVALETAVGPAKTIRATGGFAKSPFWRQMLADVFDRTVIFPKNYQGSSFGAAVLGLYALGHVANLDSTPERVGPTYHHQPIAENVEQYQRILPIYEQLLESFVPLYSEMAKALGQTPND